MTDTTIGAIARLEELAAWHRVNASHAGSVWIWDLRLRTAEDLERQAADLRAKLRPVSEFTTVAQQERSHARKPTDNCSSGLACGPG
jgi:hypothetical protein